MTVEVMGQKLPHVTPHDKIRVRLHCEGYTVNICSIVCPIPQVLRLALFQLDMMESVLVRVEELMEDYRAKQ